MSEEYRKITIEVRIPICLELSVRWDENEDQSDIQSVEISQFQTGYTPRRLCEHLSEDDLQYIDDETKKVFKTED